MWTLHSPGWSAVSNIRFETSWCLRLSVMSELKSRYKQHSSSEENFIKQGKSEGSDSCDRPSNLTQIGFKSSIFQPVWPWNLMDDLKKLQGTSSTLHQALCIISNPSVNSNWSYCLETLNLGQNWRFVVPCDLEIWWMTLKNNMAPLLCYFKLCASFHSHWWIQTGVTVRKRQIWVKIDDFLSRVTLKFDRWPWKTIRHSPKQHQASCIIPSSYVNSNWSYSPETAKLGYDLCDLDLLHGHHFCHW